RALGEFKGLAFRGETALPLHRPFASQAVRRFPGAPSDRERIVRWTSHTWAEVDIAMNEEMAMTLEDVLVRRLGLFYESLDQGVRAATMVAERMGKVLGWDSQRMALEIRAYGDLVRAHQAFRAEYRH